MADSQITTLARRLRNLERQALLAKQPTLGFSSIDDGAITAVDQDQNLTMIIGRQYDSTFTTSVVTGPTPPTPLLPLVTEEIGSLRIYWDGTFLDGAVAPMDFARVLVYAEPLSTYDGPEPLNASLIVGQFNTATGGEVTAALTPGVEYAIYLVCWTQAGKFGAASDVALGTTGEVPSVEPSDGLPPTSSPDAILRSALGAVVVTCEPIENPDPVTYDVYASKSWIVQGETGSHESTPGLVGSMVGAGPVFVRALADGEKLRPETDLAEDETWFGYSFYIVARDADGEGPQGTIVSGVYPAQVTSGEIAPESILTHHLTADAVLAENIAGQQITAEHFSSVIALASKFIAGQADVNGEILGRRVEIDSQGVSLVDVDGNILIQISTAPDTPSTFRGAIETESLRVLGGTSIESATNEIAKDAILTLSMGISNPIAGPTMANTWDELPLDTVTAYAASNIFPAGPGLGTFALDPSQITAIGWHAGVNHWLVAQKRSGGVRLWHLDPTTGAPTDGGLGGPPWIEDLTGYDEIRACWQHDSAETAAVLFGRMGSDWWLSAKKPNGTGYDWNRYPVAHRVNTSQPPIACWDPTSGFYIIAEESSNTSELVVRRYAMTNTSFGDLTYQTGSRMDVACPGAANSPLVGLILGAADFGGGNKIAFEKANSTTVVVTAMTNGATRDQSLEWMPGGLMKGVAWNGSEFWAVTGEGRLRRFGPHTVGATSTSILQAATTWYDSDPAGTITPPATDGKHETKLGYRTVLTRLRRAKIAVTLPQVPDHGGSDDPDRTRLYMLQDTVADTTGPSAPLDSAFRLQYEGGSALGPTSIKLSSVSTGTAAPPTVNSFPGANPAIFRSEKADADGRLIDLRGDGSGRVGPFKWTSSGFDATDTGWTSTGVTTQNGSGTAEYRVRNGWCEISVNITYSGSTITVPANGNIGDTDFATFPVGARPAHTTRFAATMQGCVATGVMGPGGVLSLCAVTGGVGSITSGQVINITGGYYVA